MQSGSWRCGFRGSFLYGGCWPEEGLFLGGDHLLLGKGRQPGFPTREVQVQLAGHLPVGHNSARPCPRFFSDFKPIHLTESELLPENAYY